MSNTEIVKEIHDSPLYGVIVETGCGTPVTSRLLEVSGASNTLYYSIVPYSKQYETARYGHFPRSVSREFTERAVRIEMNKAKSLEAKINFVFAQSWQIGQPGMDVITHGWISVLHDGKISSIHLTLKPSTITSREEIIKEIGEVGIHVIDSLSGGHGIDVGYTVHPFKMDAAFYDGKIDYEQAIFQLEISPDDYFLMFEPDQGMIRMDEFLRKSGEFIIQKGSFNPVHHKHIEMMELTKDMHPSAFSAFLISTYRWDKPHLSGKELGPIIEAILATGNSVIICKEVFYYNTFNMFKRIAKGKKFYFPIGSDTLNRIYKTDFDSTAKNDHEANPFMTKILIDGYTRIYSKDFKFVLFKRDASPLVDNAYWYDGLVENAVGYIDDGTSSTKIRNGEIENKINL